MRLTCPIIRDITRASLCVGVLALCSCASHVTRPAAADDKLAQTLPELPGANEAPGRFDLDGQSATIGYDTRFEKWGATVDEYADANPSLTVDYGTLLTSSFGAGISATRSSDYSEVLVNGVYAPMRDLRVRMAGGQLRGLGDGSSGLEYAPDAVLQNNYQLDVRRYWGDSTLLSDVGLAAYALEANSASSSDAARASELALGRLDGYLLDLGLRPTRQSKIELRRELGRLTYYFDDDVRDASYLVSHRVRYSQHFDNCLRLRGGYSASPQSDQVDLNIARNNWQINISRAQASGDSNTSVHLGYAIPLGISGNRSDNCGSAPEGAPAFESIVDAATRRPRHFPYEPLTTPKPDATGE